MPASIRLVSLLLVLAAAPAGAAVITVTSSADTIANDGACTLREAMTAANADVAAFKAPGECPDGSGADDIHFAIPGDGPHSILVGAALPTIVTPVRIDGYTQPGSSPNSINTLSGFNADIRVVLDGSQSEPVSKPGLMFSGAGVAGSGVRGLQVANFTSPACCADIGILVQSSASNVVIAGNVVSGNKSDGIRIQSIGGAATAIRVGGPDSADRNLSYGSTFSAGVSIGNCSDCVIENNIIGTRFNNGAAVAAANQRGIFGQSTSGLQVVDNWIGGNSELAIYLDGTHTNAVIANNLIGGARPNGSGVLLANNGAGVAAGTRFEGNVITANNSYGIALVNNQAGNALFGVRLQGNRLYANAGREFDLGANGGNIATLGTVNANDAGDLDVGPNGQQNYPVLGMPMQTGNTLQVPYVLDASSGTYRIEFSFATQCDPSGHGLQGSMPRDPLGIETVQLAGTASLQPVGAPAAGFVVATATGSEGSSEFSACVAYAYSVSQTVFTDSFE